MKKKALSIILTGILVLSFVGCSKAEPKTEDKNQKLASENKSESDSKEKQDDVWTYYEGSKWLEDYNGLKQEIEKVVVTDKGPASSKESGEASYVGVKFKLENTTENKFTTYPDQAVLVTSTGEQIEMPSMFISDHIGGEIDEGVKKEGNLIWELKNKGTAKDITWIKLKWSTREGGEDKFDSEPKKYEIKLDLTK